MSRLIDADVLRKQWLYEGKNEHIYDTNAFLDSIDEQPTAFDKGRVLEQLQNEREMAYTDFDSYAEYMCIDAEFSDYFYKGLVRAIEIVEKGVVDETRH